MGKSVAAAWDDLYYLERACEVQPPPGHTRRSPPATRTHLMALDRIRMCAHRWEPCVHVARVVASTIARSACPVRCKPVFKASFFTFQTRPPASSGWAVWSGCCPRIARCPLPPGDANRLSWHVPITPTHDNGVVRSSLKAPGASALTRRGAARMAHTHGSALRTRPPAARC